MIVCPEMSVDSDRDSVIESDDGKEAVVRQFFFSFTAFFNVFSFSDCTGKKTPVFFFNYSFDSIQMRRTLIKRRKKVTIILRR